jgi:hypothetical protein
LTVNGTTTTINATTITVDDKNIELGSVATPTDVTAEGGGITLKGATDKTFNWVGATAAWTSSEDLNLLTGKVYEINGTSVLSSSTLGSGVVNSSLTSVGTLGSLAVTNNVSAGAYLTAGSSTAGTFQTAGNVNSNNLRVVTASSLGTVQAGTWNGSSISTTYTDAKVVSVNGSTGAVTGLATTAGTLAQFGATTSAQLLGVISDETGSGSLVFATSPTLVTPVIGAATGTSLSVSGNIIVSSGNTSGNGLILSDDGDIVDMNDGYASMRFSSGVKIKSAKYSATDAITLASTGTLTATGNVNSSSLRVTTASSLGTVQSGTWNGSSISTTYTDAKVTSVNGSTGAITGLATTAGTLAQFGATTSSQLAGVISDETGSGALVFATSPTLVTPALGTPSSGTLTNCTFPTLNQNTTGTAAGLSSTLAIASGGSGSTTAQGAMNTFAGAVTSGSYLRGNGTNVVMSGIQAGDVPTLNQSTTGSAATLTTPRAINGVNFDGSAAITVTAAAGTLSGGTLASGVTASSLTSVGTIGTGVWQGSSISTTYTDAKVTAVNAGTGISVNQTTGSLTVTNTGATSIVAGTNIAVSGATGAVTVSVTGTVAAATNATNATNSNITDDTSTNSTHYPNFVSGTSGNQAEKVSSTKLTFNPSTGLLTSTDYNSSSDKRLKKNIKTVTSALATVDALRGVSFEWKEGGAKAIGMIAQEVQEVIPDVVTTDDNGYMGIKYTNMVGVLVEAIKELKAEFEAYKKTHP